MKTNKLSEDSQLLLARNKFNEFARKKVLFVGFVGYRNFLLMQEVGLCAGTGTVNTDDEADFVVFADGHPVREYNKAQLIDEASFTKYIARRREGAAGMAINEWEVPLPYRKKLLKDAPAATEPPPKAQEATPKRIGTLNQLSLF